MVKERRYLLARQVQRRDFDVEPLREDRMRDPLILDAETRREDDASGNEFSDKLQAMIEIEGSQTRLQNVHQRWLHDAAFRRRSRIEPRVP